MTFVTPALLAGILLIGLPIVLHLVMRREPQHVIFPALRFIQIRRTSNQTRLKLRHWLLLALRCALIALLALALARPSIRGSGKLGGKNAPIAAALVFDNSLRMKYIHENQTRLDKAKQLADWLLEQLPADTPIAVVSRDSRQRNFAADRPAAQLKVSRLTSEASTRPLEDAFRDAVELLQEKTDFRPEIYVLTDLSQATWNDDCLAMLQEGLELLPEVSVYVLDVGARDPRNLGLAHMQLSSEVLTTGTDLSINTHVIRSGNVGSLSNRAVELFIHDEGNGPPQKRGVQILAEDESFASTVNFTVAGLPTGTHQGYVRITGEDALAVDDTRYFTVHVRPPRNVLIVAGEDAAAIFLKEALAPSEGAIKGTPRFVVREASIDQAAGLPLADYDAVCVLDPGEVSNAMGNSLVDYVRDGGGVGIFLGRNARRDLLQRTAAAELLPGNLRWQSRDETYLRPVDFSHPALRRFVDYAESIPWSSFPVFTFWELQDVSGEVHVIASYANGKPAILEKSVGKGRVLTVTTPISDAASREPWNLLPTGSDPWPFLVLVEGTVDYLCNTRSDRLNYKAGQTVVLEAARTQQNTNFVLRMPGGQAIRQTLVPGHDELTVTATTELGNYRILAGGESGHLDLGFSVNPADETSSVERVPFSRIEDALGADRIKLARTTDEIELEVGLGRMGRELFPWLILMVAFVLGAEYYFANRFYRREL